jgi:pyridinium-3,5-bisthiocarboxylic acid mononucleotide nickel chelatase
VSQWTATPAMTVEAIGHGAGRRDLGDQPNVLRLLVGTAAQPAAANPAEADQVWILETNVDDAPAEVVGYCFERLFAAGALDVFATPVQMKKNRPGVLLSVIAAEAELPALEAVLFRETGTFGVRRHPARRSKLQREACTVQTPWGPVQGKRGWREGVSVFTPEYEDCARVAREFGVPLREVYRQVQQAAPRP